MRWRIEDRTFNTTTRHVSGPVDFALNYRQGKLLEFLIVNYERAYKDKQLIREVWEGMKAEGSLCKYISVLRDALGGKGKSLKARKSIIDTDPYRLMIKPELIVDDERQKTAVPLVPSLWDERVPAPSESANGGSQENANVQSSSLPSDLKQHIDAPQHTQRLPEHATQSFEASGQWERITFDIQRDLKPAIMGMPLGPADAAACPRLLEVAPLVAQIRNAYSARLVGESGTGKSICAYQVASEFAKVGWEVYRLRDSTTNRLELRSIARRGNTFLLIDDAHLMSNALLKHLEGDTTSSTVLLSVYTESDFFARERGAISVDARRAVNTIAEAFSADLPMIWDLIRAIADAIGVQPPDITEIKRRLEDAQEKAQFPWQFCFMLSGGMQRTRIAADSARSAGADVVLACAAINQIATDDAPLSKSLIIGCLPSAYADANSIDRAISWLVSQRLLISPRDLRCPHLRFARVLLEEILRGQDHHRRSLVANVCESVLGNESYPVRGVGSLVFAVRTGGAVPGEWRSLLSPQSLMALGERCWKAETPSDKVWAARLLVELDSFIPEWFRSALRTHIPVLASWISSPAHPSGWGLADLLQHLHLVDKEAYEEAILASEPVALASAISRVKPEDTVSLGLLLRAIADPDPAETVTVQFREWKESFMNALDRSRLMEWVANWPSSECLFHLLWFCAAIDYWDEGLFLDLVEQSLPRVIHDIHKGPFHALNDLELCLSHVVRTSDLLSDLRPQLRRERRRSEIVRRICGGIEVKNLASHSSRINRDQLSDLLLFLALLQSVAHKKAVKMFEAMDWGHIGTLIDGSWEDLPRDAEVLLARGSLVDGARQAVTGLIERGMNPACLFPPRLVIAFPAQAARHINEGGDFRFRRQEFEDWVFWSLAIMTLAQYRPEVVMDLILKREEEIGLALSGSEWLWYKYTTWFAVYLVHRNPDCLQRILSHVCVSTARSGWVASLKRGGSSRKAVSLLIEAAKDRSDAVGQLARELRIQFPKSSLAG